MKKIDFWISALNMFILASVTTICVFYVFDNYYEYYNAFYPFLLTIIYLILFYSVYQMRKTIKSIAYAFPNEKLMCVHFINFPIWIVLITSETVLGMISA